MSDNSWMMQSLLLGGYRSFGAAAQRFPKFSKINLLIGPNNSGKSNVLKYLHEVHSQAQDGAGLKLKSLDHHIPDRPEFRYGRCIALQPDNARQASFDTLVATRVPDPRLRSRCIQMLSHVLDRKAQSAELNDVWLEYTQGKKLLDTGWEDAFKTLLDNDLYQLWTMLTGRTGGNRHHWWQEILVQVISKYPESHANVEMIPAIREVGRKGSETSGFGGAGLIERLARLQNPSVDRQADRQRFEQISKFLQVVTDNKSATIEVPYERDTIIVHMNGKALPLEAMGTGIHEVIILAAAATVLEETVVCMEEPELHLNPVLQRKLVRYLADATTNQYFITTHSAALMDTPDAEIYHIQMREGQSIVDRVTSGRRRSAVCEDLGYHPSDILQANCVIWVEGPSDRIYLLKWIQQAAPALKEGIHFAIMFYGGRLAAHVSGNDIDEDIDGFISLLRLNRRAVILIDSDRARSADALNSTKERLVTEFNKGPGHAWVTQGREVENYLKPEQLSVALENVVPTAKPKGRFGQYSKPLAIETSKGKSDQAPKVAVAKFISEKYQLEDMFDLRERITKLIEFIKQSNPAAERVEG